MQYFWHPPLAGSPLAPLSLIFHQIDSYHIEEGKEGNRHRIKPLDALLKNHEWSLPTPPEVYTHHFRVCCAGLHHFLTSLLTSLVWKREQKHLYGKYCMDTWNYRIKAFANPTLYHVLLWESIVIHPGLQDNKCNFVNILNNASLTIQQVYISTYLYIDI